MKTIGQRIRSLRKRAGLTVADLAGELGVCGKTILNYEWDKNEPGALAIITMAELFGVTAGQLLGLEALAGED